MNCAFRILPSALILFGLSGVPIIEAVFWNVPVANAQAVPEEVRRGYTLLGEGLVNDAIESFRQVLRRYPQSLPAQLGLAIAYRRAGQDADAFEAYERALEIDPVNQLALKSIGLLGAYRSEWQVRGIEALTTLLNLTPNDTEARTQRAALYGYQQQFDAALADYEIVLRTNPTPDVLLGAAQIYTYNGNYPQAAELFSRYRVTGKPIVGYAAIAYARALRETGKPAEAVQVLESLVRASKKLDDQTIQARVELSQAYVANQQPTEALAVIEPLRGRPDALLPLARSLSEIGRTSNNPTLSQEAAALYQQALAQTPNPPLSLVREVADVLSGVPSEQKSALQLYQILVAREPNDKSALVQQLVLENQLGLIAPDNLQQRLLTALQPLPTDPEQLAAIAQALIRLDPPAPELLPVYQGLLSSGVDQPFLNFRIAQMLIGRNELVEARRALTTYTATAEGTQDQAPQLLLAEIDRREGNLEASAKRYQTLISSNPADSDLLNAALRGLAGIRLSQGKPDDALTLYDQLLARNPQDLTIQLGRASIAYQAKRIEASEAEAVLNKWVQTRPTTDTPPELLSLVAALPPNPQRESLYNSLLEVEPNNLPIQLRLIQVIAARNPAEARSRVQQLIVSDPKNIGAYFVQGELAQALGDLKLADQAYQNILAQQPDNTDALSALGGIRFQQRRFDDAQKLYSEVLAIKPQDRTARRSLAGLIAVQDRPLEALQELEQLQLEQLENGGGSDGELSRQRQQLQENFLRRRGFQPPWERY